MCGIVGYSKNKKYIGSLSDHLKKASEMISHRGPDDNGIFVTLDKTVGLAHRRLSIIDTSSNGHQPMVSDDNQIALVFNGEIYNFEEIRLELSKKVSNWKSNSDTEVLLNYYLSFNGDYKSFLEGLNKLNGIFGFAIWDNKQKLLILARDSFGVKPIYFTTESDYFAFASELKGLIPFIPKNNNKENLYDLLDPASLERYLTYQWCPGEGTPFKKIKKLDPGNVLIVKEGVIKEKINWYRLPIFKREEGLRSSEKKSNLIKGLRYNLRNSVHRQLVSDVPVGAFLSGGLDSSSIVAFAKEKIPNLKCFTIDSSGLESEGIVDDLPYAKEVANYLRVPLEILKLDSSVIISGINNMIWQLDEPIADPAPLNVFYISQLAKKQGIKVLLSGCGGDDIFTGYRRHFAINNEIYWNWIPSEIKNKLSYLIKKVGIKNPYLRRFNKLLTGVGLDNEQRLINYFRWINKSDLEKLYSTNLRRQLKNINPEKPMLDFISEISNNESNIDKMLALEQRFFLSDHNLNYTDKMSMKLGVEVRVPFLDNQLVEFADTIPYYFKQRGRIGKWIFKKAMEPYLPRKIIYRPKTGFGLPLRKWIKVDLKDWISETLSYEKIKSRGLFDPKNVIQLIKDNENNKIDASYTIFSLACIEIWCQYYID